MSTITTYRKKPVEIQAMLWDGTPREAGPIINWMLDGDQTAHFYETNETEHRQHAELRIPTLEGTMTASPGDFIIRGVQGEFYPCKPDIFAATYDRVTPDLSPAELATVTRFGLDGEDA